MMPLSRIFMRWNYQQAALGSDAHDALTVTGINPTAPTRSDRRDAWFAGAASACHTEAGLHVLMAESAVAAVSRTFLTFMIMAGQPVRSRAEGRHGRERQPAQA